MGNNTSHASKRSWVHFLVVGINILLIFAALSAAFLILYVQNRASAINRVALSASLTDVDSPKGQRVMNILLVGSDSSGNLDPNDPINIGRTGQKLGDVIIIVHLDERTGDMALLSLPRDLWVPIPGIGRTNRINKAFEAGGPAMLVETIEENFDIPIHHYANVDFAGFQGLVETVGSVDIYFEQPARDWNTQAKPEPRTQTGFLMNGRGCQALEPEQALAYVRSRYYQTQQPDGTWVSDPTSDLGRIRRQQDFLRRLMKRSIDLGARNPFVLSDLIDTGLENVIIDDELTPQLLMDLAGTYRSFDPSALQTYSLPVVDTKVGSRLVLVPAEEASEPVLSLFRGAPFDSASTVGVSLVADESFMNSAQFQTVADGLDTAGFIVNEDPASENTTVPETKAVIKHGPDGKEAADLVAQSVDLPHEFQQIEGIFGRSVTVVFPSEVVLREGEEAEVTPKQAEESSDVDESDRFVAQQPESEDVEDLTPAGPSLKSVDQTFVPLAEDETLAEKLACG